MLPTDINTFPSESVLLIQSIKSEFLTWEDRDTKYAYKQCVV